MYLQIPAEQVKVLDHSELQVLYYELIFADLLVCRYCSKYILKFTQCTL